MICLPHVKDQILMYYKDIRNKTSTTQHQDQKREKIMKRKKIKLCSSCFKLALDDVDDNIITLRELLTNYVESEDFECKFCFDDIDLEES